jgi:hypothetical protein
MSEIASILSTGILATWLALSLLVLIPRFRGHIHRRDLFSLIPEWSFFAPNPAQGDFHLVYRDILSDGTTTTWAEISFEHPRRWWHWLWNPGKRPFKALFDAVVDLALQAGHNPETVIGTVPYITLLNHVAGIPRVFPVAYTQFMVLHSEGTCSTGEPEMLFVSNQHAI